jgi:parallel beta-helix repeat protein
LIDGAGYNVTGDGNGYGLSLIGVTNVTIKNLNVRDFEYGVYAEATSSTNILTNNITANTYDGIGLFLCINTFVLENTISWNGYDGIEVYNSSKNNIQGNHIAENGWFGVSLYEYSTGNVSQNRIEDNTSGIELIDSSDNRIFHNDFRNQTLHVFTQSSSATWDNGYPSGGNFWSDYAGNDNYHGPGQNLTGSDGIGDTNYTCTENNIDNYPLMNTWINLAVADVLPSKSAIGEGYKLYISVTVQNQGWNAQTTNLTVYVNTTVVGTIASLALPKRSQAILIFTWQTTPALRGNYVVSSTADPVPNEPDVRDNDRSYGRIVKVTIVGDVNGDGVVDIFDAITLSNAFASVPSSPTWNGNADINSDNSVDIFDAILLAANFNKKI